MKLSKSVLSCGHFIGVFVLSVTVNDHFWVTGATFYMVFWNARAAQLLRCLQTLTDNCCSISIPAFNALKSSILEAKLTGISSLAYLFYAVRLLQHS